MLQYCSLKAGIPLWYLSCLHGADQGKCIRRVCYWAAGSLGTLKQGDKRHWRHQASKITRFSVYILDGWIQLSCNRLLAFGYEFTCVSVLTWNDPWQNKAITLSLKCLTAEPTKRGWQLWLLQWYCVKKWAALVRWQVKLFLLVVNLRKFKEMTNSWKFLLSTSPAS